MHSRTVPEPPIAALRAASETRAGTAGSIRPIRSAEPDDRTARLGHFDARLAGAVDALANRARRARMPSKDGFGHARRDSRIDPAYLVSRAPLRAASGSIEGAPLAGVPVLAISAVAAPLVAAASAALAVAG